MAPRDLERETPRIIASKIRPQLVALRAELRSARDKLWGEVVKGIITWEFPSLALAHLTEMNVPKSVVAFAAAVRGIAPHVVDYYRERSDIGRRHAVAYLIGLSEPATGREPEVAAHRFL